jgi:hypothetical protein
MQIDINSHPNLAAALRLIEEDNGGHLIGTVYPGTRIDLSNFHIPTAWEHLVAPAEVGLTRLRTETPADWDIFIIGEYSEMKSITLRQGDLYEAEQLLQAFFDAWQCDVP